MFKELSEVSFPAFSGSTVNMMPFVMGDVNSLPDNLKGYQSIIDQCALPHGDVAYLTVSESMVSAGKTQRRGGIHVEAPFNKMWGGGAWGGCMSHEGIYMASTDGRTEIWNTMVSERNEHGGCDVEGDGHVMSPNTLYWMTDLTPHAALSAVINGPRQFIRVVSSNVSVWFKEHNTANPLGVLPTCPITTMNKFN